MFAVRTRTGSWDPFLVLKSAKTIFLRSRPQRREILLLLICYRFLSCNQYTKISTYTTYYFTTGVLDCKCNSFLGRDSDPVMQNDLPSKTPLADSASSVMVIISESSLIKSRRLEMPSLNIVETFSPIPSMVVSSSISPSSTQCSNFSIDVKC